MTKHPVVADATVAQRPAGMLLQPREIREQGWRQDQDPLVSICCLTYAHESYIRDALEGFLMQQTTFGVEILIHDDASPDSTSDIIREYEASYPGLIKPVYQKENKYSQGVEPAEEYLFPIARGEYIALCEGDDYWTDPYKLQKQVEFLESHPTFSMCVGGYSCISMSSAEEKESVAPFMAPVQGEGFEFSLKQMEKAWLTKTLTAVFRKGVLDSFDLSPYRYSRDIHLFYHLAKHHKAFYFSHNFGVYRIHKGGVNSMHQGAENKMAAYNCYRELYLYNRDAFTRNMAVRCTLGLLNYNLYHRHKANGIWFNLRLLAEAVSMTRSITHIKMLAAVWFSRAWKDRIKHWFNRKE